MAQTKKPSKYFQKEIRRQIAAFGYSHLAALYGAREETLLHWSQGKGRVSPAAQHMMRRITPLFRYPQDRAINPGVMPYIQNAVFDSMQRKPMLSRFRRSILIVQLLETERKLTKMKRKFRENWQNLGFRKSMSKLVAQKAAILEKLGLTGLVEAINEKPNMGGDPFRLYGAETP